MEFMLEGKTLLDYTNLFSPNDKIIYKYFKDKYGKPWICIKKIHETGNYILKETKDN